MYSPRSSRSVAHPLPAQRAKRSPSTAAENGLGPDLSTLHAASAQGVKKEQGKPVVGESGRLRGPAQVSPPAARRTSPQPTAFRQPLPTLLPSFIPSAFAPEPPHEPRLVSQFIPGAQGCPAAPQTLSLPTPDQAAKNPQHARYIFRSHALSSSLRHSLSSAVEPSSVPLPPPPTHGRTPVVLHRAMPGDLVTAAVSGSRKPPHQQQALLRPPAHIVPLPAAPAAVGPAGPMPWLPPPRNFLTAPSIPMPGTMPGTGTDIESPAVSGVPAREHGTSRSRPAQPPVQVPPAASALAPAAKVNHVGPAAYSGTAATAVPHSSACAAANTAGSMPPISTLTSAHAARPTANQAPQQSVRRDPPIYCGSYGQPMLPDAGPWQRQHSGDMRAFVPPVAKGF